MRISLKSSYKKSFKFIMPMGFLLVADSLKPFQRGRGVYMYTTQENSASLFISLLCENSSTSRMQCLLFPWSTEGQQAKTEEEFSSSYGSCTHTVLLWLPNVEWTILIGFASLLFLFLLYPLLCLCTDNSLLPCVSSDNELKFRCGVLQFGSLSLITWNPSTLRFQ